MHNYSLEDSLVSRVLALRHAFSKHEGLSWIIRTHSILSSGVLAIPELGMWRHAKPLGSLAIKSNLLGELQANENPPVSERIR